MARTCKGTTKADGKPCTRKAGWGLPPGSEFAADYCVSHTPAVQAEDEERKEKILEILRNEDKTIGEACDAVGISVVTLYRLRLLDPAYDAKVAKASEGNSKARVERVASALYKRLIAGGRNPSLSIPTSAYSFYLTNRDPENWRSVSQVQLAGNDGGPLEVAFRDARTRLEDKINRLASRLGEGAVPFRTNGRGGS